MDFDFSHIAVPFRMQPGLLRMDEGARHLHALDAGSPLFKEKQAVAEAGRSRLRLEGFDPQPALDAIRAQALRDGLDPAVLAQRPLELAIEEDLAVLDGRTGTLPWLCVCTPSHWAPEEKLGLDFVAVHAPVAEAGLIHAAASRLVALATGGQRWERHVWSLSPSGRYDQHPQRQPRAAWPATDDPEGLARATWLRTERQTFFPVGGASRQAVFTIRVQLSPLADAVDSPLKAQRLHDSLASMSPAILAYKGLTGAVPRLLPWLARQAARPGTP